MEACWKDELTSLDAIGAELGVSGPTVRRRLNQLREVGIHIGPDENGHFVLHESDGDPP